MAGDRRRRGPPDRLTAGGRCPAALTLGALALALAGCPASRPAAGPPGLGRRVFSGPARGLSASADGAWLAFLTECREARGEVLPPRTASCDLEVAPSAGGPPRRVAEAVTTLPQGLLWSPEGDTLAVLAGFDYPSASGTLVLVRGGGGPQRVADGVTFHGFVPGEPAGVAAVAGGRLLFARAGGSPEWFPGAEGLGSFEVNPAWSARREGETGTLLRRSGPAGGALLAVAAKDGKVRELAPRTGDYRFSPSGSAFAYTVQGPTGFELRLAAGGRTRTMGREVTGFAFARDGGALAFVAGARPGLQGDLYLAPVEGGEARLLAREVGEYRWAAHAPRLAWLERYDPRVRSGTAGAQGSDGKPRTFASNVSDLELAPDGRHLAFLQHTTRGGYSVDLGLADLDGPPGQPPATVAQGVFGFAFSPDGRWLYYRTRCTRNAEACDLERVPAGGLAPGTKPEAVVQAAKSFEFDPRDPGRLLVTWQRADRDALDLAVWEAGRLTRVDTYALPGSARFLGPDSRRLAYAVIQEKRAGVYVADLGEAGAP